MGDTIRKLSQNLGLGGKCPFFDFHFLGKAQPEEKNRKSFTIVEAFTQRSLNSTKI
jgi:hypothetical protein